MIEHFSEAIAKKLKRINPEETKSVEVMKFGLAMSMNFILSVGCSLLFGLISGRLHETFEAIVAFALLRRFSGGVHAKNLTRCFFISVFIFALIPHVPLPLGAWTWLVKAFTLLMILLFAPTNCEENNISEKKRPIYKLVSVMIVLSSLFYDSSSVTLAMLSQVLLLRRLPIRRR